LPNELSTDELLSLIDKIDHMGTSFVVLTGGEPLLRRDILEIVKYSCNLGLKTVLATNGFYLTHDKANLLATMENLSVQISLDGASAVIHDSFRGLDGSFERAIYALRICAEVGIDVSASVTVTWYNFEDLPKVIDLGRELRIPTIKLRRFIPNGQGFDNRSLLDLSPEEMRVLVKFYINRKEALQHEIDLQMEQAPFTIPLSTDKSSFLNDGTKRIRGGCSAGNAICVIDPVGNVRPCPSLPVNVGNVKEVDFQTIWESSYILNQLRDRSNLSGRCKVCEYRSVCGGCRAAAFSQYGNYLSEDPKCWYTEALKEKAHKCELISV